MLKLVQRREEISSECEILHRHPTMEARKVSYGAQIKRLK